MRFVLHLVMLFFCPFVFGGCYDDFPATVTSPLKYPRQSDLYAVQYQLGGGSWTTAEVYVSYYGATLASPYRKDSGYVGYFNQTPLSFAGTTSMSFVSIPAQANALVRLRVTKLFGTPFQHSDHVSVRPSVKPFFVETEQDGTALISTFTATNFAGEQFILWWERGTDGGAVEGLAFFLNPPYPAPAPAANVKVIRGTADLSDLTGIDTLDFEGFVQLGPGGAVGWPVPDTIRTIYFGPGSWVQGKLQFNPLSVTRTIYGPGVLDVSRFDYKNRLCGGDDGLFALTTGGVLDHFVVNGIVIADHNHAADDAFYNSTINNVKTLGWNGENAALRFQDSTTGTNLFVRSGDDSLMIWGVDVNVNNATVWQNYNGGVVNLGWLNNAKGTGVVLDGLWVVKTDWMLPASPTFDQFSSAAASPPLANQNNGVFVSLMVPSTSYGTATPPPVFRNTFVEDPPQVLFSLKIVPTMNCSGYFCTAASMLPTSTVKLTIENLYSPQSRVSNSIGFDTLKAPFVTGDDETIQTDFQLTGTMDITLNNVFIKLPSSFIVPLLNFNGAHDAMINTRGNVTVSYGLVVP